jgi:hypothetical protein
VKKPLVSAAAGAVLSLVSVAGVGVPPAGAGRVSAELEVTKTVEGPAPEDAEFVIAVECVAVLEEEPIELAARPQGETVVVDVELGFPAQGGTKSVSIVPEVAWNLIACTVVETDDGGADQVIGGEQTVLFEDFEVRSAEVINVFEEVEPTTSITAGTTTTTAAATAARATPRFTG